MGYPTIPVWGKYRVYNTPQEALESIPQDDVDNRRIRLVLAASTRQLRRMLLPGKEACQVDAALYLEVADSCPFYHLTWEEDEGAGAIDITSNIPHTGSRDVMVAAALGSSDGREHALVASVPQSRKNRGMSGARQPIVVSPGDLVVGGPGFARWMRNRRETIRCESSDDDELDDEAGDDDGDSDNADDIDEVDVSGCSSAVE